MRFSLFSFRNSLLTGMLFLSGMTLGVPIPDSGIDWQTSTLTVQYSTLSGYDPGLFPSFTCFGSNVSPVTIPFNQINGGGSPFDIEATDECFQQAGEYRLLIDLIDFAGNVHTEAFDITIYPATPDESMSTFVPTSCSSPLANNTDTCTLEFQLKDSFGNNVVQIPQTTMNIGAGYSSSDDANTSISFFNGLRVDGLGANIPQSLSMTDGAASFDLTAIAPTVSPLSTPDIDNGNTILATLSPKTLNFSMSGIPTIENDGTPHAFNTVAPLNINHDITFGHLMEFEPFAVTDPVFYNTPATFGFTPFTSLVPTGQPVEGAIFGAEVIGQPTLVFENVDFNETSSATIGVDTNGLAEDLTTTVAGAQVSGALGSPVSLRTVANYSVDGYAVSYPAGGTGLETANFTPTLLNPIGYNTDDILSRIIGLDVEGRIIADSEQALIEDDTSSIIIGDDTSRDLSANIRKNALGLIRQSSNIPGGSGDVFVNQTSNSWNGENVLVVENRNVILGDPLADMEIQGRKTLIVKNGNILIDGNISYDDPTTSALGVIMINDTLEPYPTTGNIFIGPQTNYIVGFYYADGGLMQGDTTSFTDAGNINDNDRQLILHGTIFTQNTIGGSLIFDDNGNPLNITPWEDSTNNPQRSKDYDLHFVRKYTPATSSKCTKQQQHYLLAPCDENINAFIIRNPRTLQVITPPGFETAESLSR